MNETTWRPSTAARSNPPGSRAFHALARTWNIRVLRPLHRALDAALSSGELETLDPATLADIGYRRG